MRNIVKMNVHKIIVKQQQKNETTNNKVCHKKYMSKSIVESMIHKLAFKTYLCFCLCKKQKKTTTT